MVQLMGSFGNKAAVKLEVEEDSLEDQLSPLHKRSKLDSSLQVSLRFLYIYIFFLLPFQFPSNQTKFSFFFFFFMYLDSVMLF